MPLFCRHNRLEANCPICSREKGAARPASRSSSSAAARRSGAAQPAPVARRHGAGSRGSRVVTRRLARATEDGYEHALVPGVKATADAARLATALALAEARLEYPGPHPAVAEAQDPEQAIWLALLLALAGPDRAELQQALLVAGPTLDGAGSVEAGLGADAQRTIAAYRAWVARDGSQRAAIAGEASWTAQRRFGRLFDRLSLPGFARGQRYEFLVTLGAAGVEEVEADALHVAVAHDDATTLGAKRALNSGDAMLLERRAAALADATGVPIGALDRGLALWDRPQPLPEPDPERLARIRAALRLG